jgi:hypothetical protein
MADVRVRCPHCGTETTLSQYTASDSAICPSCKASLGIPEQPPPDIPFRLNLRHAEAAKDAAGPSASADQIAAANVLQQVYKSRQKVKPANPVWSWVGFVVIAGLLIGFQCFVKQDAGLLRAYQITRSIVAGVATLLVLVVAFEDSPLQGILCILLPMYVVYYAFIRLELYWVRGLFLGAFVAVCTELYFIPADSLLVAMQAGFNRLFEAGSQLIQRAGEPPDLPK